MKIYSGRGLGDFYLSLIRDITNHGRQIETRGHKCLEMPEPIVLVYTEPGACWMNIPGRRFNPFFALAEVVWILGGNGNVEWISYFNSQMRRFSDGGENFHGAYGPRMRGWPGRAWKFDDDCNLPESHKPAHGVWGEQLDQIQCVVRKLQEDSNSRQAVISLWDPLRDNLILSKDYPCNNVVYFCLRQGVLDMSVVIRSNDLVWGTPYNAVQFTHLHAYVAGLLGAQMGVFTYFVQNLHYYLHQYPETLSALLRQAFDSDFKLQAENHSLFRPPVGDDFGKNEFDDCSEEVSRILTTNFESSSPKDAVFRKSGYWGFIIPLMIWVYSTVKDGRVKDPNDVDRIADWLRKADSPFVEFAIDFFRGSKNPIAQEVVYSCERTKERS